MIEMKKSLALILALVLTMSLFAACGSDEGEATATNKPATTSPAKPTPTKAPTEAPTATQAPEETKPPVEDDVDAQLFRFYDNTSYMWDSDYPVPAEGKNCYPSFNDALFIDIKGEDPFVKIDGRGEGASDEFFSLAEYPVLKICLLNNTPSTELELFLAAGEGDKAEDCFHAEITAEDEEFQTYVFDISKLKGRAFVEAREELNHIRIDCVNYPGFTAESMYSFSVAYFGFFKTVEEAEAWTPSDY